MPDSSTPTVRTPHRLTTLLLSTIALMTTTGCSVFGIESVEEAPYELVMKDKQFEIREYAPLLVAETRVTADANKAGRQAFRRLFGYISGDNESSEKIAMTSPVISDKQQRSSGESIAMTAPVILQKEGEQWRYRFVLPESFSLDTAPRPTNPEVSLVEVPQRRVATLRYAGRMSEKTQLTKADVLGIWISEQNLVAESQPRWAGYNAPWTLPWFRRNEVLIDVSRQ